MNIRSLFFTLIPLFIISSCTKNLEYKPKRLKPLKKIYADDTKKKDGVRVSIKTLDDAQQYYYFGEELRRTEAIQIAIDNESNTTWVLDKNNISIPLEESMRIAKKLQASPWTSIGIGIVLLPIGISHGIASREANKMIARDIQGKTLQSTTIIPPELHRDTLIFTKDDTDISLQPFSITLVDAENEKHKLVFNFTA